MSSGRAEWVWLLLEPISHVVVMLLLMTAIRTRIVPGADAAIWLLIGLATFFTARNIYSRGMEAITANRALFAYRQVLPVDTILVRAALEAFLGIVIMMLLLAGAGLFGFDALPHDPLEVLTALAGLCLCGLGFGLIFAVSARMVPEAGKIIRVLGTPLYFFSGTVLPVSALSTPYREWLLYNPFADGLELVRGGFFPLYHVAPEASLGYLYGFALVSICLGLAMNIRFSEQVRAE